MNEKIALGLIIGGVALAALAHVWLLIRAFRTSIIWGVVSLLIPFGLIVYGLLHFRRSWAPLSLGLIGAGMAATPLVVSKLNPVEIDTTIKVEEKAAEKDRSAGVRITLTGAGRDQYAKLVEARNVTVVQWANADVTDGDAEVLFSMEALEEIDLASTQITDETVLHFAEMKTLKVIKIQNTKATPASVVKLLELPNLRELDVRGLKVPGKLLRDWKDKDRDNRKFAN